VWPYAQVHTQAHYAGLAHPWALITATLVMQRKPLYYLANLVLPSGHMWIGV
jgi:hypothetical protein